jgi:hypothetical protein
MPVLSTATVVLHEPGKRWNESWHSIRTSIETCFKRIGTSEPEQPGCVGQKHYRAARTRPSLARSSTTAGWRRRGTPAALLQGCLDLLHLRRFDNLYGRKSLAGMQRSYLG